VPLLNVNPITARLHHKHALLLHFHFTFNVTMEADRRNSWCQINKSY